MFRADVICSEEAQKRRGVSSSLDGRAASGLFALDNADNCGDDHTGFLRGLNGGDGRCAGGADVIDNDDSCAFTAETFDAAACAMRFLGLANQEAVKQRRVGMRLRAPGTGGRDIRDDRVSAHGEAADGFGFNLVGFEQFEDRVPGQAAAFGVQSRRAAVNVVVACAAGGKLELAKLEAGAGQQFEQLLPVSGIRHWILF